MGIRLVYKNQRGLTLIELLLAIALTGIISATITMGIFQVFDMNTRTSNRLIAVSQVQHAGKMVSRDVLQAQIVTAGPTRGFPLTLNWTVNTTRYGVIYSLEGTDAMRTLWVRYFSNATLRYSTKVAEHIVFDQTDVAPLGVLPPGGVLTFNVTATVGDQTETRVYRIDPRPGS
jgi:prepilin-type N-terminal cleavage/methylation domain-containing protein